MACRNNVCPRCGRARNARGRRGGSTNVVTSPTQRCLRPESTAEELYSGTAPSTLLVNCCDRCGCRPYDASRRNPFWPSFCRPRWLTCEQLYCRRR